MKEPLIEQFGTHKNPLLNENFDKIYNAFNKKDYWDVKGQIKTLVGNWTRAKAKGDKGADKYTEQDIIKFVKDKNRDLIVSMYEKVKRAIKKNDINYLKSILRHDQLVSKAFFMDITGKKLPKSTRDIHKFLEDFFGIDENIKESINEGTNKITIENPSYLDWNEKMNSVEGRKIGKVRIISHKNSNSKGGGTMVVMGTDDQINRIKKLLYTDESINEAISQSNKFKVYNGLKKGDLIDINYDSATSKGRSSTFVVTKGKSVVGKRKVERIILQLKDKPNTVKFYLYNSNGNIALAIGDMAATITDMKPHKSESISERKEFPSKEVLIKYMVKYGHNPKDAKRVTDVHYDYVKKHYQGWGIPKIIDVMWTI
jgi:hypothetical protein